MIYLNTNETLLTFSAYGANVNAGKFQSAYKLLTKNMSHLQDGHTLSMECCQKGVICLHGKFKFFIMKNFNYFSVSFKPVKSTE